MRVWVGCKQLYCWYSVWGARGYHGCDWDKGSGASECMWGHPGAFGVLVSAPSTRRQ